MDRALIGKLIAGEIARNYGSVSEFVRQHPKPARRSLDRAISGDERVDFDNLAKIEGSLALPRGAFSAVGQHDWDELSDMGVEPDLVRWIRLQSQRFGTRNTRRA